AGERCIVTQLLARIGGPAAVQGLSRLADLLTHEVSAHASEEWWRDHRQVSESVVSALVSLGPVAADVLIQDPDPSSAVLDVLGRLGDRRAVLPLLALLHRKYEALPFPMNLSSIVQALGRLGDRRARPALVALGGKKNLGQDLLIDRALHDALAALPAHPPEQRLTEPSTTVAARLALDHAGQPSAPPHLVLWTESPDMAEAIADWSEANERAVEPPEILRCADRTGVRIVFTGVEPLLTLIDRMNATATRHLVITGGQVAGLDESDLERFRQRTGSPAVFGVGDVWTW
ncbi:MAG: hypothetical protein MUE34_05200, partial [Acidimicrobiales bacterium]|nr:hypothetical protein [Acidimicrobiales bacterium]